MRRPIFAVFALLSSTVYAAPGDFESAIDLVPEAGRPVQELVLPDSVYGGVLRADLGDVRVFNAQGTPVPFALCAPETIAGAAEADIKLPIFPLQAARSSASVNGTRVEIQSGGQVTVEKPAGTTDTPPAQEIAAYVIDARAAGKALSAIRLSAHAVDGASEIHVRIDASDDLDQWRSVVAQASLVHSDADGQTLQRQRIPLPLRKYAYLRVTRSDAGSAPILDEAIGEPEAPAALAVPPLWFDAKPKAGGDAHAFDAARLAPVASARVLLPGPNMSLQIALQSRASAEGAWHSVWTGTVFSIGEGAGERHNEDIALGEDRDRYWRIQVLQGADSLAAKQLSLSLGYRPWRLRFLAEGSEGFLLAYGSAHPELANALSCESFLQGLPKQDLESMIGHPGALAFPAR